MDLNRFVSNVTRWKIALAVFGALAWWLAAGKLHAMAFCAGALASAASFWFLSHMVRAVGSEKVSPAKSIGGALRLAIIGYGIRGILAKLITGVLKEKIVLCLNLHGHHQ